MLIFPSTDLETFCAEPSCKKPQIGHDEIQVADILRLMHAKQSQQLLGKPTPQTVPDLGP